MRVVHVEMALIAVAKAAKRGDFEAAHSLEDKLFVDALTAIARAENEQGELARAALRCRELQFTRTG